MNLPFTKILGALSGFLTALLCCSVALAQPNTEIDLKKPEKYENRKLASEKTDEKKFTLPRKLYQNTVTHYNYYFNANNRLNELVKEAKASYKDDYSQLLPFYNYTLEQTSQNKTELDSIIYKCTAGILLHDLRNSWIDNMYLLLGKAYFFRNDLDSAALTYQYLNFAYAPKEEGGYDKPIGSNSSNDEGEFSIATKEKGSLIKKLVSRPPSRNESFIWQIRNSIEKDELPEAAGLLEILRNDPNFPDRLNNDLQEVLAYWFYKQQVYDSAAVHLSKALDGAENKAEKARWEYLIAQMNQLTGHNAEAVEYYDRAISHTTDPIMDVYARLNSIKIKRNDKKDYLQQNIDALHKMAKRDKYENYRDIIYYAAANIELERQNFKNAKADLLKSVEFTQNNPAQRSQSFLLLADMSYNQRLYTDAHNFYDSLDVSALAPADQERVAFRKPPLEIVAKNTLEIEKQDSLQALALMPAAQRDAIIKKQVKQLKKDLGIKEDEQSINPAVRLNQPADLFADNTKSGDFYFYNAGTKAKGFSEFKAKWGERKNVDNWRRMAAVNRQIGGVDKVDDVVQAGTAQVQAADASYEALLQNVPLTPEKLDASNNSVMQALFTLGETFATRLEEYPAAIAAYEELLRRFPNNEHKNEAMFNLIYAYQKTGNKDKANEYKNRLSSDTANNKFTRLINNPPTNDKVEPVGTKTYEDIYNLFIEGKFEQAKNEKKAADSLYGKMFWTPQLLFIESIYYIKQREDSTAISILTDLANMYAGNPMADRATTMVDVLKRRKEIEEYLTNLEVTRNQDSIANNAPVNRSIQKSNPVTRPANADSLAIAPPVAVTPGSDTTVNADSAAAPVSLNNFTFAPAEPHYVVIVLDKVDPVYASEGKNAFNRFNKEKYYNQPIEITSVPIDERYQLILEGPFADAPAALDYIDKVRPVTKSRILPWLSVDKYSFMIISNANLETLKAGKNIDAYKQLIQQALPGKF